LEFIEEADSNVNFRDSDIYVYGSSDTKYEKGTGETKELKTKSQKRSSSGGSTKITQGFGMMYI
jgi:hypothetical protein